MEKQKTNKTKKSPVEINKIMLSSNIFSLRSSKFSGAALPITLSVKTPLFTIDVTIPETLSDMMEIHILQK